MFVSEAESLATLAGIIGRPEDATKMAARAASQRGLIAKHLWDEQGGIYTNKFWNGTFYRRISPTSFYAMMAGAPTDEQAAAMVTNWLLNPDHFCVAPNGDFKGNSNDWCVPPPPPFSVWHLRICVLSIRLRWQQTMAARPGSHFLWANRGSVVCVCAVQNNVQLLGASVDSAR